MKYKHYLTIEIEVLDVEGTSEIDRVGTIIGELFNKSETKGQISEITAKIVARELTDKDVFVKVWES